MLYAKQVSPEYQESPLFMVDEWPEGIILDGNKRYNSHTIPAYDHIIRYFDEMAGEWENSRFYWTYENGQSVKHSKRPEYTLKEILRDYGFSREDGKAWTTKQRHEWRQLMESDHAGDDDEIILPALRLLTGKEWAAFTIRGTCQGEYQEGYYIIDEWNKEAREHFEAEYFNTGSEWIIHDEDTEPQSPEEISGYSVYCYGWNDDLIRAEIAEHGETSPENVVLYAFEGYSKSPEYRKVS